MGSRQWTRQDIADFVTGRFTVMYGADHRPARVPGWIVEASLGEVSEQSAEVNASAHPDDRPGLIRAFWQAVAHPGEVASFRYRTGLRGDWMVTTTHLLNLVDHPDVGGVLGAAEPGNEAVDEPDLQLANEGEHDARGWILGRVDARGYVLGVEGKVAELTGRQPDELVGLSLIDLLHPDSTSDSVTLWWHLISQPGNTATSRRCFAHPDGGEVWAECTYLNRLGEDGSGDVLWMAFDITDRRAQEQALRDSHDEVRRLADESRALAEDLRLLADEVPAAVFRCDADGTITFHNARWSELLPDRSLARVHDAVHPEERSRLDAVLAEVVDDASPDRLTVEVRAAGGDRVFAVTFRSDSDGSGNPRRIVGSIEDATATVLLRREARHDELTGLLNRKGFEERLADALVEDPAGTLVVFFDLDGFKAINDVHGHEAGDAILQELGARLAGAVRPTDTVSRYGGDEFVLVCTGVVDDDTTAIRERLELVLATPIPFHGGMWRPAASLGTARAQPGDDVNSLVRRADLAMFEAKRARYGDRRTSR